MKYGTLFREQILAIKLMGIMCKVPKDIFNRYNLHKGNILYYLALHISTNSIPPSGL
jgi:hypothetical protein